MAENHCCRTDDSELGFADSASGTRSANLAAKSRALELQSGPGAGGLSLRGRKFVTVENLRPSSNSLNGSLWEAAGWRRWTIQRGGGFREAEAPRNLIQKQQIQGQEHLAADSVTGSPRNSSQQDLTITTPVKRQCLPGTGIAVRLSGPVGVSGQPKYVSESSGGHLTAHT